MTSWREEFIWHIFVCVSEACCSSKEVHWMSTSHNFMVGPGVPIYLTYLCVLWHYTQLHDRDRRFLYIWHVDVCGHIKPLPVFLIILKLSLTSTIYQPQPLNISTFTLVTNPIKHLSDLPILHTQQFPL